MLSTIEELREEVTPNDLEDLLSWYGNKATLQRLGFLLDKIDSENSLSDLIFQHLEKQKIHPVLLKPTNQQRPGSVDNKWKVDINLQLESDL